MWSNSAVSKSAPAYPLESVDRCLRLVALLQAGRTLTVTTAAQTLEVAPSTAHRLLGALCYREFAMQDESRQYIAGPAISPMTSALTAGMLRTAASRGLHEIYAALGETTHLMVLRGTHIQFIDGIEADQVLRVGLRIGGTMPAYCSAGGKAMLAELPPAEVETLHRGGLPPWPTAKVSTPETLGRMLAQVRRTGYGVNVEETEVGVCGIGAAITDANSRPVAAFTIAVPLSRFDRARTPEVGEILRRASAQTAGQLASS